MGARREGREAPRKASPNERSAPVAGGASTCAGRWKDFGVRRTSYVPRRDSGKDSVPDASDGSAVVERAGTSRRRVSGSLLIFRRPRAYSCGATESRERQASGGPSFAMWAGGHRYPDEARRGCTPSCRRGTDAAAWRGNVPTLRRATPRAVEEVDRSLVSRGLVPSCSGLSPCGENYSALKGGEGWR
jgi:hypothetical protein